VSAKWSIVDRVHLMCYASQDLIVPQVPAVGLYKTLRLPPFVSAPTHPSSSSSHIAISMRLLTLTISVALLTLGLALPVAKCVFALCTPVSLTEGARARGPNQDGTCVGCNPGKGGRSLPQPAVAAS
jgi:hypothetical protein